jgi:hypothetical protein
MGHRAGFAAATVMLASAAAFAALAGCAGDDGKASAQTDAAVPDSTTGNRDASIEAGVDVSPDGSASDGSFGAEAIDEGRAAEVEVVPPCSTVDGSLDPAAADAGKTLVSQYSCTKCHGSGLVGSNTTISDSGGLIYPPNLTPDPMTGLGCWTDDQIARAILDAIDNQDADLCMMPPFRLQFVEAGIDPDAGAFQIVQFLRSRRPVEHMVPDTLCPTEGGSAEDGASPD